MRKNLLRRMTLCALVLAILLVLPWGSAAGEPEVYQLAVNESFLDKDGLTTANMPVAVGGTIYVPYTVFDKNKNNTGVDLGISCLEYKDAESHALTMFSLKGTLIFDINAQTCLANDEYVEMRAIVRNGKTFVPANGVCQFFGLQYSYRPTETAGTLIRIKNSYATLSDERLLNSSESYRQDRYDRYIQSLNAVPTATPTPTPSATPILPDPTPEVPEETSGLWVYLAVRCEGENTRLDGVLTALKRRGEQALFLFRPEELAELDEQVRRVVGAGHAVGLLVDGSDAETTLAALEEGNALLADLVWSRSHIVCLENGNETTRRAVEEAGWHLWSANLDASPYEGASAMNVSGILSRLEKRRSTVRMELTGSAATSASLERLLLQMEQNDYRLRPVLETELG